VFENNNKKGILKMSIQGAKIQESLIGHDENDDSRFVNISQDLLLNLKTRKPVEKFISHLKEARSSELRNELNHDSKKKAFWINIYNAFGQILLKNRSKRSMVGNQFVFGKKKIKIAGHSLSLNNIEHSILRRSKIWWSRGYLKKWFPADFEKKFRVDRLDARIHFALNCGAVSCPPIRFYEPGKIDKQLDLATQAYLEQEVKVVDQKTILVPMVFSWFVNDFGKKDGIRELLLRYKAITENESSYQIKFEKWNSKRLLDNFG
jgi:hypothetical protein